MNSPLKPGPKRTVESYKEEITRLKKENKAITDGFESSRVVIKFQQTEIARLRSKLELVDRLTKKCEHIRFNVPRSLHCKMLRKVQDDFESIDAGKLIPCSCSVCEFDRALKAYRADGGDDE